MTRNQTEYWNSVAENKTFSHPLPTKWLEDWIPSGAVLDIGCGYGRSMRELTALNYSPVMGVDTSSALVKRGLRENPDLAIQEISSGQSLPFKDESFDLVLLIAVLTCIPSSSTQDSLMEEARRVLEIGGFLLISDLPLQEGERHRARYEKGQEEHGEYGVFSLADGGIVRHHDEAALASYGREASGFVLQARREVETLTMNGNPCKIAQLLLKKVN